MFSILPLNYAKTSTNTEKTHSTSLAHSYNSTISSPQQISLQKKVNNIAFLNLKDHDLNICACQQCIYARQLNRKHKIGLELTKNTSYRYHFNSNNKGKPVNQGGFRMNYDQIGRQRVNQSLMVANSNYDKDYFKEKVYDKPNKMKPEDELKFIGPVSSMSSYQQQYPSFKNNANPYVKPVEISVQNTLKMNTKSSYTSQFHGITKPMAQSGKNPDQIHCGMPWTGKSTYKEEFLEPSKLKTIVQDNSRIRHQSIDANYKHQYETSYRNQYIAQNRKRCVRNGQNTLNPLLLSLQQSLEP